MESIEELRKKIDILQEQIAKYQQRLSKERFYSTDSTRKLHEKIYDLKCEIIKIEKIIEVNSSIPIISDEVVDLYKNDKNPTGYYIVCLHGSKTIVGEVGCNGENNNVHYFIAIEHQNKGYGFHALVTMLNYLILNNIENISIILDKENNISLKLAEKLKAIFPTFNKKEIGDYISYQFNLGEKTAEKHNAIR